MEADVSKYTDELNRLNKAKEIEDSLGQPMNKPLLAQPGKADDKAETFRPFLSSFGVICVSNEEAAAESKFDIVFLAGRADSEKLSAALDRGETPLGELLYGGGVSSGLSRQEPRGVLPPAAIAVRVCKEGER